MDSLYIARLAIVDTTELQEVTNNRIFTKLKRAVIVYRKKTICANSEGETEQKTPNEKVQLYLLLAWSSWISFLARMVVNKSFGHQQTNVAILLKKTTKRNEQYSWVTSASVKTYIPNRQYDKHVPIMSKRENRIEWLKKKTTKKPLILCSGNCGLSLHAHEQTCIAHRKNDTRIAVSETDWNLEDAKEDR